MRVVLDFLRRLLFDLLEVLGFSPNPNCLDLSSFPFPQEVETIKEVAQEYFSCKDCQEGMYPLKPCALLFALRSAERGRKGFEFGIVAKKGTDLKTQCEWACATLRKNFERFKESGESDFIAFLGKRWAPVGAENDLQGLNRFWVDNVKFFYYKYLRR